jgi:cation-transporting ATPase E
MNSSLQRIKLAQSVENWAIIASLVPNGLFLSIAVAYAIGAVRIIRFGALVQQSNAIESLSNVDVLCMDKTGTLTSNRLQVNSVQPFDGGDEANLRRILGVMAASTASPTRPPRRLLRHAQSSRARSDRSSLLLGAQVERRRPRPACG